MSSAGWITPCGADGGFGTADYLSIKEGEAWVVDAKFGRNQVDADCDQLKCYALRVFNDFGFDAQLDTIHMTIVQPRLGHIDTHTMRHRDLLKWGAEVLAPAAEAALGGKPQFNPGESQCRYCKAAPNVPCAVATHIRQDWGGFFVRDPEVLSNEELAALLPHLATIKSWCDSVARHAEKLALSGVPIEGYKLRAAAQTDDGQMTRRP